MSEHFAEATVAITPKLGSFVRDLNEQLTEAMKKVKPPVIRVSPGLTRDFVGDLRKQVDAAVLQAQKGIKPIRIKAFIEPVGIAPGTAGALTRAAGAAAGGAPAGGGGGAGTRATTSANQALQRSLEHVATAQLHLNAAFDESLPLKEQINAVTKVTTALDDAQAAAERTLTKAIVSKDAAAQKAARKQLTNIKDFQAAVAPRAAQVEALVPAKANESAIKASRRAADATKDVVAGLNEADAAAAKLGTSTQDLAAQQDLLKKRTQLAADATKAETKALNADNAVIQKAAINAKVRAVSAVEASKAQIQAIKDVQKAEAAAAKQSETLRRQQVAAQQRAVRAAAAQANAERRRSEQLTRGGQASLLSLAGIRGATLAASRSFLVGAAAITVFARAVKQFADLERNLHVFEATTSATADQMEAVREQARALGADLTLPAVSAGDAAGAMVELAKAGLSVQDSIDGARGVLELATAAAIDNADAVRLVANVLNAFSLAGKEASTVADVLANAANAAQGSIADIGTAFQQAASAGHQVGLSFQDTATFLTILAKNGIRGSDAGTSLRTALIRLVNPSEKAKKAFQDLGIVLRDARGNIRPDVFLQIADATAKLGPAQRDATIALIGGQDAFRAVTILGRQTIKSFLDMRAALREEGTAAELARARTEGLHGAMDGLQSVVETVGTDLARHVGPGLAGFVRTASSSITALSENAQVATTLDQSLRAVADGFNILGEAIQATLAVAIPFASVAANLATGIGVGNIVGGVIAFKALSAVLDGAILRLKILKPLFATIATARLGAAIGELAPVGAQLTLPFTQAERAAVGLQPRLSATRVALKGIGQAALAAAASTTALAVGVGALAAGILFLVTRESSAERATRKLREETEALADAFDRTKAAAEGVAGATRANEQALTGVEQANINLLNARAAFEQSNAPAGSRERRQLLLNLKVATQDLTFANQDYQRSLRELEDAQEAERAATRNETKERRDATRAVEDAIEQALLLGRTRTVGRAAGAPGSPTRGLTAEVVARQELIKTLREQAFVESLSEKQTERNIARSKQVIATLIERTKIPLEDLAPDLSKILNTQELDEGLRIAAQIFGKRGKEAIDAFVNAVQSGLAQGKSVAGAIRDALAQGDQTAAEKGRDWSRKVAEGFTFGTNEWAETIGKSAAVALGGALELALAEAKGFSLEAQLTIAQGTLASATSLRQRLERNFRRGGTQEQRDALERALDAEKAARADVERIQGDIDQARKDQEQDLIDAQKKSDEHGEKIVDAITKGRRATLLQRKITTAGLTEWLGDDLKTTQAWLNFLIAQKKTLVARLKAVGASRAFITQAMKAISDLIFDVKNSIASIGNEIANNVKTASDILSTVVFQKIDIRIQIAQTQENVALELALRRKRLELITKELVKLKNAGKKNTLAWLELKLAQVEEIAAINDLTKTQKDRHNAFGALAFQFLQLQSGFAANLLGNLIPGGATGGLVGGTGFGGNIGTFQPTTTGPLGADGQTRGPSGLPGIDPLTGRPVRESGGVSVSGRVARDTGSAGIQGPTKSQAARTNFLLQQMLVLLRDIKRGQGHPEAKTRRTQTQNEFAQTGNV